MTLTTMGADAHATNGGNPEVPQGVPDDLRELIDGYGTLTPLALARKMLAYRKRHAISQQELARRTGITAGVVHHLESLLTLAPELIEAMEGGKLTFKEGRSLADLRLNNGRYGPDHERQREIAAMFLSGRRSSVYVEAVVGAAKARPEADADAVLVQAIDRIKHGKRPPKNLPGQPKVPPLRSNVPTPSELKAKILDLAAMLTIVQMHPYAEVDMLCVRSAARILTDRLKALSAIKGAA